jgi:formyl-CoA transferase
MPRRTHMPQSDVSQAVKGNDQPGPLRDIRVIEMGQLIAGPFCGQLLADFGADVVKIEPPGQGDPMRQWGRGESGGESLWFPIIGRGKCSVTLDLRKPRGQALARELIAGADILIENFRPGTMERWGLDYATLSARNPRLIMVRVTGYGQTGPYASRAGFGAVGEAMGGLRHIVGDPASPPSRVGISIGDSLAATYACLGAMMALHARGQSGRGQVVDSAIYEAVLANMESLVSEFHHSGRIRERTGAILPRIAPSNVYPTRDGLGILIAANQDTVFGRLCAAMGRASLANDARYATHEARGQHQTELDALIADWTRQMDAEEVEALVHANGIPAGRIYRAPEMLCDPHYQARQAIVRMAHPKLGEIAMQNVAPRLSETPGAIRGPAPELGQHTREVLAERLGLNADELDELVREGTI